MPKNDGIDDVRQFIFDRIDSVEQLEVLLLLRRDDEREWHADAVSRELRTNLSSVGKRLEHLAVLGLIRLVSAIEPKTYRYDPQTPELARLVDLVDEAYRVRRHLVFELIFSPAKRARGFADAFRVNKGGKKDG